MYLFPTKALAEDQLHEFRRAVDAMGSDIRAFTYDGDTPQDARKAIRERANVVLTNPDMLHSGILPHHTKWAKCFENLRYFVIDELHYYRGVYGSHLANLLRRLKRICEFYGSSPQFHLLLGDHRESEGAGGGADRTAVRIGRTNGAPSGEKYFVFYNPPVVNRQLGIRRSYIHETRRIALEFIERGLADAGICEQPAGDGNADHLFERGVRTQASGPAETIRGYRGGYLAEGASRDRAQAARRRHPSCGVHQRARTGNRYRLARRGRHGGIPGNHRLHLAARRACRAAVNFFHCRAGGFQRAASISTSSSIRSIFSIARLNTPTSIPTISRLR